MPISINGAGTVTGITAGGLPDGIITAPDLSGAQTGSAPIYGCRAWVNFDGTRNEADTGASTNGANVKIRASGNVTSVLKNGTGDYTVTFTTAMADVNYSLIANSSNGGQGTNDEYTGISAYGTNSYLAGSVRIGCVRWRYDVQVMFDSPIVSVSIFR